MMKNILNNTNNLIYLLLLLSSKGNRSMIIKIIDWLEKKGVDREDIIVGLAWGLAWGLAGGLVNLSTIIPIRPIPITLLLTSIIILTELLFNPHGYTRGSKFWFTAKRKLLALTEAMIISINVLNLSWLLRRLNREHWNVVLKWIGYVGVTLIGIALIVGVFYLWIKINEKKVMKERKK